MPLQTPKIARKMVQKFARKWSKTVQKVTQNWPMNSPEMAANWPEMVRKFPENGQKMGRRISENLSLNLTLRMHLSLVKVYLKTRVMIDKKIRNAHKCIFKD